MSNPILREMIAREQYKDLLREAEQIRLAEASSAREPAERFELRYSLKHLVITIRQLFRALARAH